MDDGEGKKWKWGDIERSQKSAPSNCYFCRLLSTLTLTAEEEWCLIWVYFPCVCDFFRDAFCSIVGHCSKYLSAACKRAKWKRGSERLVKTLSEKKLVPCQSVTKLTSSPTCIYRVLFRCASISWFQAVSGSVTYRFQLAHLRVFQSYCKRIVSPCIGFPGNLFLSWVMELWSVVLLLNFRSSRFILN